MPSSSSISSALSSPDSVSAVGESSCETRANRTAIGSHEAGMDARDDVATAIPVPASTRQASSE